MSRVLTRLAAGAGLVLILGTLVVGGLVAGAYVSVRAPERVPELPPPVFRDLDAILRRDTLYVLTTTNSTSYFLYRGQAFGYEYELLEAFAEEHGIELAMRVVPPDSLFPMVNRGEGDIAAARLVQADRDTAHFRYTTELYRTRPVLVQLDTPPEAAESTGTRATPSDRAVQPRSVDTALVAPVAPDPLEVLARFVQRPTQLVGSEVHLPENSPYLDYLVEIEEAATGDIRVIEVDTTVESLIRDVARADIAYTVAQEDVAELEASYFRQLAIRPVVGPTHGVAWAVRGNAPLLLRTLDAWIEENREGELFERLYQRYYVDRQGFRDRVESRYLTGVTRVLSEYDGLLRAAAAQIGWDWRLLASQAFQESRFDARARSWAGAMGLLQLMPATARDLGVADPWDPEENADGAVRYLRWLEENYWREEIPDERERLKFVLASYNAGAGHVMDARRLAERAGDDPDQWADVAYWLLQKSRAEVYNDPIVRHGFCRGLEPVQYVARILDRYEHYRQFVPADTAPAAAQPAGAPPS